MATIVIMEDDQPLSAEWQSHLEDAGYEVVQTRSATECLQWIDRNAVDVLITDIYVQRDGALVPDGGIKLIGLLRAAGGATERATLPIIAVTGMGRAFDIVPPVLELARSLGANLTFQKPVAIPELLHAVDTLLSPVGQSDAGSYQNEQRRRGP